MSKTCAGSTKSEQISPYYKILKERVLFHIKYSRCKTWEIATDFDKFVSLAHAVRDLAVERMIATQKKYQDTNSKRVYYLSMEFLMGRALINNVVALDVWQAAKQVMSDFKMDLDTLADIEDDEGLGNGGLGRLAACFLDSMATMELPAYGYGLRYQYGIFRQEIHNGWQVEYPNDWLKLDPHGKWCAPNTLFQSCATGVLSMSMKPRPSGSTGRCWKACLLTSL